MQFSSLNFTQFSWSEIPFNGYNVFAKQILLQPNYLSNVSWANFRLTGVFSYGLQVLLPVFVFVWIVHLLVVFVVPCSVLGMCWISDRDLKLAIHYADFREKKVSAVMLWLRSLRTNSWLFIYTFVHHSVWVELERQKRHNLHFVFGQSECDISKSVFRQSECEFSNSVFRRRKCE